MTTITEIQNLPEEARENYQEYRSMSALAVVTLFFGLISLLGFFASSFLPVAIFGIVIGLFSIRSINRNRDYLSGISIAYLGTALSTFCLLVAGSWHYYDEYIDIPEGYVVMSFSELQSSSEAVAKNPIPEEAWQYDGQKVLVKGYVYPHDKKRGLTRFVLVPDFDTCCFGGQPKLTDMIEVSLKEDLSADFSYNRRKLGGTLKINKQVKAIQDLQGVYYELDADYID